MLEELSTKQDGMLSEQTRVRCFAHILNLAAKAILKQFEVPKAKAGEALSDVEQVLADLMKDVDLTDDWSSGLGNIGDSLDEVDDNNDGEFDVRAGLSAEEIAQLDSDILPLKQCLAKVREQTDCIERILTDNPPGTKPCFCNHPVTNEAATCMVRSDAF